MKKYILISLILLTCLAGIIWQISQISPISQDNKPKIINFSIKRAGSEAINKNLSDRHVMVITISADADFDGEVSDTLPKNVEIVWQGPASVKDCGGQACIIWQTNLKKDIFQEFKYEYLILDNKLPITLGPIEINKIIYENLWTLKK